VRIAHELILGVGLKFQREYNRNGNVEEQIFCYALRNGGESGEIYSPLLGEVNCFIFLTDDVCASVRIKKQ
jgi:hypothetical protein